MERVDGNPGHGVTELGFVGGMAPSVENCGIVHKRRFTAENVEVAEEIFLSNHCVLRLNLRPSAKSADHSEEIFLSNLCALSGDPAQNAELLFGCCHAKRGLQRTSNASV